MKIEDVISNFPVLTVDAVGIAYRPSFEVEPEVVWVNDALCGMFGIDRLKLLGRHPSSLCHAGYVADFEQSVTDALVDGKTSFSTDMLCLRGDGSAFWASVSYFSIPDDHGDGRHAVVLIRDIDVLKNREQSAELALIENEILLAEVEAVQTRLMTAINTTPDPFAIFDSSDRLVIWNPAFSESLTGDPGRLEKGMDHSEILHIGVQAGIFPDAVGRESDWLDEQIEAWHENGQAEIHLSLRDREYRVIRSTAPNGDRIILHVDISDFLYQQRELESYAERLERANHEISHQALHDELTGLGNRRYLNIKLAEMIATRRQTGGEIAALHIDLDWFKQINDTMGHAAGDHVLNSVASSLRGAVRDDDIIARTGGDEFVVLVWCKNCNDEPENLAARLIEEMSLPVFFENRPCRFSASIGIARTPVIKARELLTSSDLALYRAKSTGRSKVAIFDNGDLESIRKSKRLTDEIMRGLEKDEFVPFYQPQIDSITGRTVCFEVLARWQHPERGLLLPTEFLNTAFELQVDGQIDSVIFRRAIEECSETFSENGLFPNLSFNVSMPRMMDPSVAGEFQKFNYAGEIAFELIETVFLEGESDEFLTRIDALRKLGIKFEVDDFGSGRASIIALRRLAPDRLKIDRRLIQPITQSTRALKLVRSIIDLGHALDIGVTAEGIESAGHFETLRNSGCNRLQGFYFARPLPLKAAMLNIETSERDQKTDAFG